MEIEDFCYIRCVNCKNVIIVPISYNNNYALLSNMCHDYSELNECCNDADVVFASVEYGIENEYIKISDLPLKLRKGFPLEITHKFDDGKHSLIVTKYNGDTITISVENDIVSMDYNDGNHPRILDILVD